MRDVYKTVCMNEEISNQHRQYVGYEMRKMVNSLNIGLEIRTGMDKLDVHERCKAQMRIH